MSLEFGIGSLFPTLLCLFKIIIIPIKKIKWGGIGQVWEIMRHLSESHLSKSRGRSKNAKQEEDEFESEMRWDIWKWEGRKLVYERKWIWDWDETHFKWKSQPRIVSLKDDFEWKSYMAQIMRNFFSLGLKDACSKVIIPCMLLLYLKWRDNWCQRHLKLHLTVLTR